VGFRYFSNEMALAKVFCRFIAPQPPGKKVVPQKYGGFGIHFTVSREKRRHPRGVFQRFLKYDETEAKTLDAVRARFLENLARMERLFLEMGVAGNEGHTLGIYVPGRMINTLSVAEIPKRLCLRFFDDNPLLENKYYPSFPQKIENFDDLLRCPPDSVFVASRTFGKTIEERIGSHSEKVRLIGWDEVFS